MINNQTEISKQPQVTLRGTLVGLGIGTLILLSNFQFGLQTGWVSMMSLPAALLAYSVFKVVDSYFHLNSPFTPQENVYVQSVAVAVATGPLAYGFIGIIPAIEKLLTPAEAGIINDLSDELSHGFELIFQPFKPWWKLLIWGSGLAFFGVFFAIPLREEFIIKQKLKFPSGSATATLISVFHNFPLRNLEVPAKNKDTEETQNELSILREGEGGLDNQNLSSNNSNNSISREEQRQIDQDIEYQFELNQLETHNSSISEYLLPIQENESYSRDIVLLLFTAMISSIYTLTSYFIPHIRIIPIFGNYLSSEYLINFTPSPAYIGQGIIMGFETTSGMLAGMIIGWCILSPLAKYKGWAPGETGNWKDGSEGWIMWISLSIMIADSIVALILMSYRSLSSFLIPKREIKLIPKDTASKINKKKQNNSHNESSNLLINSPQDTLNHNGSFDSLDSYSSTQNSDSQSNVNLGESGMTLFTKELSIDSNNENSIDPMIPAIGLILCCPILVISIKIIFGSVIPPWILILTIPISLILSLIGVKSLGETDLNPVSGIGKLSQLLTALVIPSTRPGAVLINLIVGAISEATAQQAGDLMQDLKTGYLLHGSPQAQFLAQIFGSIWGVLIAAPMYRWYDKIYQIPGPLFKIPTAVIWIDCARLVNGHDLPDKVGTFVIIFGILFSILSLIRGTIKEQSQYYKFSKWIPSGVAVGIGIYNTPSFTLARFLGGLISFYWIRKLKLNNSSSTKIENGKVALIIFSSGLVLGEGLFSVINMLLASFNVPHL
jgi:OPT family oligopeptide transporter